MTTFIWYINLGLCSQCLSVLKLVISTSAHYEVYSKQFYVLLSVALKISGFLLLLLFAPSIKLTAKI